MVLDLVLTGRNRKVYVGTLGGRKAKERNSVFRHPTLAKQMNIYTKHLRIFEFILVFLYQ